MSNQSPAGPRGRILPNIPTGDVIGTYDTYVEAQDVVGVLVGADLDSRKLSIVGSDLKSVEFVTGRLSYGRAAASGAATGAWLGLFVGIVVFIFAPTEQLGFILAAALIGAGFGMLFNVVTYSFSRRRRNFLSTHQVLASSYQVVVDPELTARAHDVLARTPGADAS